MAEDTSDSTICKNSNSILVHQLLINVDIKNVNTLTSLVRNM